MNNPIPFEQEYPEAGAVLKTLCNSRMTQKLSGKKLKPLVLAPITLPITTVPTTGRNDKCPCGSGKKFKKCCIIP